MLTAATLALVAVKEMGGHTLISRLGLGVQSTFLDKEGKVPDLLCPTCAVAIGAARTPLLAKQIRVVLMDAYGTAKAEIMAGLVSEAKRPALQDLLQTSAPSSTTGGKSP